MVAAVLRALGDTTRIRLIEVLNERGGATVSALAACVPVSQQRVSQQLAILHEAGIVCRQRDGMSVRYELIDWAGWWLVEQLAAALADGSESRIG
jgi:DNA-binding transcriptional ArsR family regulator